MNKKLLKLLIITLGVFQFTFFSCSKDDSMPEEQVVVKPNEPKVVPKSELMKPAIKNISSSVKTTKVLEVQKRVIRSIKYAQNFAGTSYQYMLNNMEIAEYRNLPSENLYDTNEIELNKNTPRDYLLNYNYNDLGQLSTIEAGTVYTNDGHTNNPEQFSFKYENGALNEMTSSYAFGSSYSYNSKGLIDKKIEKDGFVSYEYNYDDAGRILSVYFYMMTPNGRQPQIHYTYTYTDDTSYIKGWYSINPTDQKETMTSFVVYTYDPSKAGVYNKEPFYRLDNTYLHVVKIAAQILINGAWQSQFEAVPKYFYDADGYLIKFDAAGFNYTQDITVFEYQ
ncbi:hypothetical protein [Flavobacterium sp.]|uniref:hypothetical protein n=1 Tax=Flavobacterium sp. TaxID=239 RepID=UPI00374DBE67